MNKSIPVIGFLVLSVMALMVFGSAALEAFKTAPVIAIAIVVTLVGLLYQLSAEAKTLPGVNAASPFAQKNLMNFAAVVVGALISFTLAQTLGLGAVVGAGLVGLVAGIALPAYGVPLYTGAFVGMASAKLLATHFEIGIAGIIAGIVFVLATGVFDGFGGKLGTIAVSGCFITGICLSGEFSHPAVPSWSVGIPLVICSVISVMAAYYINVNLKRGPVIGSAVVGVIAGFALPALFGTLGSTLAVMSILASFAGMSNAKRFPSIMPMALVGVLAAIIYMYSSPFIGGAGGKLGTIAFASGMAIHGLMELVSGATAKQKTAA